MGNCCKKIVSNDRVNNIRDSIVKEGKGKTKDNTEVDLNVFARELQEKQEGIKQEKCRLFR